MPKNEFIDFIYITNKDGSQKASSYLKALSYLEQMLRINAFGFEDCVDFWSINSVVRIQALYALVLEQTKLKKSSPWVVDEIPESYLRDNFCSAALKHYIKYLTVQQQEDALFGTFQTFTGSGDKITKNLDVELDNVELLIDGIKKNTGEDILREVKTRRNQNLFRRMIMSIYNNRCCVTGLDIPTLNRASHIVGWAENTKARLNPSNGLCLSATYDAAFDKKLISFDDDYRMLVSREIKEHYSNEITKRYFEKYEGTKIQLPTRYAPDISYLRTHREQVDL